jgi:hypothetical protein
MLPPNSINSWKEIETHFHEHLYIKKKLEVTLADLAKDSRI